MFNDFHNVIQDFNELLRMMVERDASDLFITADLPPSLKVHGEIVKLIEHELNPQQTHQLAYHLMDRQLRREFEHNLECNFAIAPDDIGRFRVNVFKQKSNIGIVLRRIKTDIPVLDDLGVPDIIKDITMTKRGLVLLVGATGTGKSTTLAAMIGHRNHNSSGHIVTVEDPIEFVHEHSGCIVTQREVGVDTHNFEAALQNTLRQAPDVILIGEVRSRETMEHAIAFAETGHLCLTTLHANNANQALDRILNFFPKDRRDQILSDLSLNLKAVIAQQLLPTPEHDGRVMAMEVLINTPLVSQLIKEGNVAGLKEAMGNSNQLGMRTFDQALYELYKDRKISYDDALHHADSENELRLMIKLDKKQGLDDADNALDGVTLVHIDEL
ncbi:MAG: PilT/PilU family type 4a pilus ATPase [Gammaproteobacteria bacterium]|nr:PilT/PilU family type 4a pilus ATPase [Gammaproteobacteria bacterium]MDH5802119.1 PilT/PilU family type 4a pilus ATPase [Gammaproteobacteria bacterium]